MNGIALIIFLGQVKPFFGLGRDQSVLGLFNGSVQPSWVSVALGGTTVLAVVFGPRLLRAVPGALTGLAAGLGCFFLLGVLFRPDILAPEGNPFIIGYIPTALPTPAMVPGFLDLLGRMESQEWMALLMPAFTLGMLGAIDSLLTSLVADVVTKTRHNSMRELVGQGIGNMVSSFFGGLPGAGSTVRTLANVQNGGRTRLSGMICGLSLFLILMFFGPYARYIPYAVLAGILIPTVNVAIRKAKVAKAQNDVQSIALAIKAYYDEYGRWPEVRGSGNTAENDWPEKNGLNRFVDARHATNVNAYTMAVLVGIDRTRNPKGIEFLHGLIAAICT